MMVSFAVIIDAWLLSMPNRLFAGHKKDASGVPRARSKGALDGFAEIVIIPRVFARTNTGHEHESRKSA